MAQVVVLVALALGVLPRASGERPKHDESDALEPASGVHMLASGGLVKEAAAPSMLQLKSAASELAPTPGGVTPPVGGVTPPVPLAGSPAAPPPREPYTIKEAQYRPKKPKEQIPTVPTLKEYPAPWKDAKGGKLKASKTYDKVRSKLIDGENLIFSDEFDIGGFANKGETAFQKNVEYHKALQKYVENLFKMSEGAHAVTEKEFKDQDARSKKIEEQLRNENTDVDSGLPPAPAVAVASSPAHATPGNHQPPTPGNHPPSAAPPRPPS